MTKNIIFVHLSRSNLVIFFRFSKQSSIKWIWLFFYLSSRCNSCFVIIICQDFFSFCSFNLVHCSPSGLQACTHMAEETKREKIPTNKERGIGGLCKNLQIPTLPPKSPKSGVTFQSVYTRHWTKKKMKILQLYYFCVILSCIWNDSIFEGFVQ